MGVDHGEGEDTGGEGQEGTPATSSTDAWEGGDTEGNASGSARGRPDGVGGVVVVVVGGAAAASEGEDARKEDGGGGGGGEEEEDRERNKECSKREDGEEEGGGCVTPLLREDGGVVGREEGGGDGPPSPSPSSLVGIGVSSFFSDAWLRFAASSTAAKGRPYGKADTVAPPFLPVVPPRGTGVASTAVGSFSFSSFSGVSGKS